MSDQHPIDVLRGESPTRQTPVQVQQNHTGQLSDGYLAERAFYRKHFTNQNLLPPITPTPSGQGELLLVRREPVSDHLDVQHARANLRHVKDEEQHHRQEVWDRAIQAGRVAQQSGQQIAQEQKTKKPGAPQP